MSCRLPPIASAAVGIELAASREGACRVRCGKLVDLLEEPGAVTGGEVVEAVFSKGCPIEAVLPLGVVIRGATHRCQVILRRPFLQAVL